MTDRTSELKQDYEAMQGLVERFQRRQMLKVAPTENRRWYLFEKEGRNSWIEQFNPEMFVYMNEHWSKSGWTVTSIDIFRTG